MNDEARALRKRPATRNKNPQGTAIQTDAEVALNARLANMIALSEDAIISIDESQRITLFNLAAERIFGYNAAELLGQPLDILLPERFIARHREHIRQFMASPDQLRPMNERGDIYALRKDGVEFPAEASISKFEWNGAMTLTVRLRDISVRRDTERRLHLQYAVAKVLAEATSLDETIIQTLQAIGEGIGADLGAVWQVEAEQRIIRYVNHWRASSIDASDFVASNQTFTFVRGVGLPGRVWASGQPIWISELANNPTFQRARMAARIGLCSAFGVPIRSGNTIVAVMEFFWSHTRQADLGLSQMMDALGSQIGNFMERKRAEEALRESEARFRQLAENINQVFWIRDPHSRRVLYVSPAYERVWGHSRDQLYQSPDSFLEAIHPDDRARVVAALPKNLEASFDEQYRIIRPDGSMRWIEARTYPVRDAAGQVYRWVGFAQDITEMKRNEEAQRTLADAGNILSASLDYETMLSNMAHLMVPRLADWCAVHVVNEDQSVNQVVVTHIDPQKVALAYDLQRRYPADWNAPDGLPNVLRTGQSELYPAITDTMLQAAARDAEHMAIMHELQLCSAMIVPLVARGRTLGAITLFWAESGRHYTPEDLALAEELGHRAALAMDNARLYQQSQQSNVELEKRVMERTAQLQTANAVLENEIADRRRAEAEVRRLNLELEQRVNERTTQLASALSRSKELLEAEANARREAERANELRLRFLAMISHELRTPLTSIKGFASTLLAKDVTWGPEEQHEFIHTIDEEADKLTEMIDQLLDLSRLEAGSLAIFPEQQALIDIVKGVMPQLEAVASHHHLTTDIDNQLPAICADRQRIAQVLTNLVSNAAKYSPENTDIVLSAHQVDGYVQVDVIDQGVGILPQDRAGVFEAFRRGKEDQVKRVKGAGLGLAICKGLIEAHGGRIWIQERAGPGTIISFTLPFAQSAGK